MKETTFNVGDLIHKLFDVGGPLSERKKWIGYSECYSTCLPASLNKYGASVWYDNPVSLIRIVCKKP